MTIANFSVKNHVLINMIMIVAFISGIFSMIVMPKEEAPPVDFGFAYIWVGYPGVSSSEIEKLIIDKIEEEIYDVDGIDYISSSAQEGVALIFISFEANFDSDDAFDNLNTEMDKVNDLPDDAEDPIVIQIKMREVNPICQISITGNYPELILQEISEDFKDGILEIENVSKVSNWAEKKRKIIINVDSDKLSNYQITVNDIINRISQRNMNLPGGKIKSGTSELLIRTMGEFNNLKEIENLIVKVDENGHLTRLSDIANINDGFDETLFETRLDGKPDVAFQVYKNASGNIIKVMKEVRDFTEKFQNSIEGITIDIRNDSSISVKENLTVLGRTMAFGILLVFLILFLFIGWRNALFAAWGVPFSFFTAFFVMYFFDISMNNLSLFALILVLGMIVDDAIVVIENVHRYIELGLPPIDAAIKGTNEIMWPVISAVTTTMAAFLPMLMMKGIMGEFMKVFPIVISIALAASLFESLVILPSHIAEFTPKKINLKKKVGKGSTKLHNFLLKHYRKTLIFVLGKRFLAIGIIFLLLIFSGMTIVFKFVKFDFFPSSDDDQINVKIKTPVGFNFEQTKPIIDSFEYFLQNHIPQKKDIKHIITYIGWMMENNRDVMESRNSTVFLEMVKSKERISTNDEIKESIRDYLKKIPMVVYIEFASGGESGGPPIGQDLELRIMGDNLAKLEQISEVVKGKISTVDGVEDIKDDFDYGKKEFRILPKYEKLAQYGFTVAQLSKTVWTIVEGSKAGNFRGEGSKEFDIIVKIDSLVKLEDLKNYKIRSNTGVVVTLKDIADFTTTRGITSINHHNKKRTITITANAGTYTVNGKTKKRTSSEIKELLVGNKVRGIKGLLEDFTVRYPGYSLEFGGITQEMAKSYNSLWLAFMVAALIIFTILASQFRSYVQPLIVMTALPFSFIGVILGLFISQLPFSIGTFVAVVGLAGVVVNDSLVLVDFVNKLRMKGLDRWNSLITAGEIRLRPIILTTVTTIAGFMPIILSNSDSARDWKSIAVSMSFGLAFSTFMTLLIIPCIYSIIDSIFGKLKISRFKEHISLSEALEKGKHLEIK